MKSLLVIVAGLVFSWHYMDLLSDNRFFSLFLPLLFGFLLIVLLVKLAIKFGGRTTYGSDGSGGGFGDFGGDGGGD